MGSFLPFFSFPLAMEATRWMANWLSCLPSPIPNSYKTSSGMITTLSHMLPFISEVWIAWSDFIGFWTLPASLDWPLFCTFLLLDFWGREQLQIFLCGYLSLGFRSWRNRDNLLLISFSGRFLPQVERGKKQRWLATEEEIKEADVTNGLMERNGPSFPKTLAAILSHFVFMGASESSAVRGGEHLAVLTWWTWRLEPGVKCTEESVEKNLWLSACASPMSCCVKTKECMELKMLHPHNF